MEDKSLKDLVNTLGDVLDESRCLCIGSGATLKFVGTWDQLLGTMLGERFIDKWVRSGQSEDKVSAIKGKDCFSKFFVDEGYLEKGEFLLATAADGLPKGAIVDVDQQEAVFAAMVDETIHRRITAKLAERCSGGKEGRCGKLTECPLARSGAHTLADVFRAYRLFCDMSEESDDRKHCALGNSVDTTMALVELCATGKVRYVINYNFDLVVEEALAQVIEQDMPLSSGSAPGSAPIREIHIWTYGTAQEQVRIGSGDKCKILLHRGRWEDDVECLKEPHAIHFFHVHGVASGLTLRNAAGKLVFSQHSYEEYQDSPLNWSNQVLDHMLARYSVIGIGFSGVDANYRYFAKLHNDALQNALFGESRGLSSDTQTILLKAKAPYRNKIKSDDSAGKDDEVVDTLLEYCCAMVKDYYSAFYHIRTEWADEYADVAEVVHRMALR